MRAEHEQPVSQRIAGGLVARADQQDEELCQFLRGQVLLVGRDQLADHVVTRMGDAILGDSLEQVDQLLADLGDRCPMPSTDWSAMYSGSDAPSTILVAAG